jgi:hypothetical protein
MTIDKIKEIVEKETGVNLSNPSRRSELVYVRALYYNLCREYTLHSLEAIGKSVGKNHATVLHGIKLFRDWIDQHEERYIKAYEKMDKLVSREFKKENRKYKGRDFYKRKYAKTLVELRDVRNKHRNLKKLVNV